MNSVECSVIAGLFRDLHKTFCYLRHISAGGFNGIVEYMLCSAKTAVRSYRDLVVWKKSMALVLDVYRNTQNFPRTETYGLVSQLRRAAVSIPSNIAEGQARLSTGEFRQVLGNARGSVDGSGDPNTPSIRARLLGKR